MMKLDECMNSRRSVRSYLDKKVSWDALYEILDAATKAPSSGNLQNWRFVVVTDEERKHEIAMSCLKQMWMKTAPVIVVLCDERERVTNLYPKRGQLYAIQNCALAAQNLMLKAEDLGLKTCWIGAFDDHAISRILHLPDNVFPEMIFTIGYSTDEGKPFERDSVDKVAFFEAYGNNVRDEGKLPLMKKLESVGALMEKKVEDTKKSGFLKRMFKKN